MLPEVRTVPRKNLARNCGTWATAILTAFMVGCTRSDRQRKPALETRDAATHPVEQTPSEYRVQQLPGGVVEGKILFQGAPPSPSKIRIMQDADACGETRDAYSVKVENGGVDDAVVWIDDIQRGKPFAFGPAQIEQKQCTYVPHLLIMRPGDLRISNEDSIQHNVHTHAQHNRDYDETMSQLRHDIFLRFSRPDVIRVRCDLHGWMQAYVVIAKNPYYALSANGGKFKLEGVPPGHYLLKVWNETLGESEQEIVVEAGKPTKANFTLKSQSARGSGAIGP